MLGSIDLPRRAARLGARHPGFGALAITDDERVVWTALVDDLLAGVDSPRPGAH